MPRGCYGFDTGFVAWSRGWTELRPEELGQLWEHFVLNEIMATRQTREIFYWRDKRGHEVDFVLAPRKAIISCWRMMSRARSCAVTGRWRFASNRSTPSHAGASPGQPEGHNDNVCACGLSAVGMSGWPGCRLRYNSAGVPFGHPYTACRGHRRRISNMGGPA